MRKGLSVKSKTPALPTALLLYNNGKQMSIFFNQYKHDTITLVIK